jgi:hypothetical protein
MPLKYSLFPEKVIYSRIEGDKFTLQDKRSSPMPVITGRIVQSGECCEITWRYDGPEFVLAVLYFIWCSLLWLVVINNFLHIGEWSIILGALVFTVLGFGFALMLRYLAYRRARILGKFLHRMASEAEADS